MAEMTKQMLKKMCKDTDGCYTTPAINDKLYLHYKGFHSITNLEEYTGLKALWLEGNGLTKIEGLENQKALKTLFLHENILDKIENLDNQLEMDNINFSKNYIKKVENLSHMLKLTSLNLAHNALKTLESVEQLKDLLSLQTIDLQSNKIEDPGVVDVVAGLPDLRVLYLMGNPCVKAISNYRKTVVARCKFLKYLDDRPVFEDERRRTTAWALALEGGATAEGALEAERAEVKLIRREKDEADERNFRAFEQMVRKGKEDKRRQDAADREARGEPALESPEVQEVRGGEFNPFSGEAVVHVPESAQLREIREARWGPDSKPFSERSERQQQADAEADLDLEGPAHPSNADMWQEVADLCGSTQEARISAQTEGGEAEKETEKEGEDSGADSDEAPPIPAVEEAVGGVQEHKSGSSTPATASPPKAPMPPLPPTAADPAFAHRSKLSEAQAGAPLPPAPPASEEEGVDMEELD
ncbi:hypothetical protein B484DRAFT_446000 [Ochromonadaceae sp. CCMP2298]|nr:hypothetical protein B484DRAFT_446000 [Ochromonadaceae sp. CCMP2298]|mmetsp:Transcript_11609/g.25851  ORF Transcript_11609/g.25851 Transcript_11609/m.25851 type:complete len:473 (-) Transcript_11609:94-1512(-)|eukprot:CAMPEP_0173246904 /NCGR_PEP_ID=MMETSP1142-20121109/17590_1 /TAXON_ID=483371 /ORGANISM="non described non described, Strain CCMP2298" /LENGTH=472 /DNA_ID=CAMNT_0014179207 /DNA_START=134 /DNA_END=1552 /DNA_ORIENTATION=+